MVRVPAPTANKTADPDADRSWDTISGAEKEDDLGARRRSFVSVQRLQHALAVRLGCRPTGERSPYGSFWRTVNGIKFLVNDPTFDRDSAAVTGSDGRRHLYYSYKYAASLLYHVLWLNSGARAVHGHSGPEPVQMRPSAEAMGEMLAMTAGVLREARGAVQHGTTTAKQPDDQPPLDLSGRIYI